MSVATRSKLDRYSVLLLSVDVSADSDGDLSVNYRSTIGDVPLSWYSNIVASGFKMISRKFYLICPVYTNVLTSSYKRLDCEIEVSLI